MAKVACESKLNSVVRLFMHPCPGSSVAIRLAVVYCARAANAFGAGIRCRYCRSTHPHSLSHTCAVRNVIYIAMLKVSCNGTWRIQKRA